MNQRQQAGIGSREQALVNGKRLLSYDPMSAVTQAEEMLSIEPRDGDAFRLLGAALRRLGRIVEAEQAEINAVRVSAYNPQMVEAGNAIARGDYGIAERLLRPHLVRVPDDTAALVMLARIAAEAGAAEEAEALLLRAMELAPAYTAARLAFARLLADQGHLLDAVRYLDQILARYANDGVALDLKAALLSRLGDYADAIVLHERLVGQPGADSRAWIAYGNALRTIGRRDDAVAAYRQALSVDPGSGQAWWSLGNLKNEAFSDQDVTSMHAALSVSTGDNRFFLNFALAKALEDRADPNAAFQHYVEANRLRRALLPYDRKQISTQVATLKAAHTPAFFAPRESVDDSTVPIFIIGMPRSGSTLLEQILSSHSAIEGTSELPYIPMLSAKSAEVSPQPGRESQLIGPKYLRLARAHRKTDRRFFIDKLPNNWMHIGFIHQILPNARIIDIRRHAMANGLANFRQHFGQGHAFAFDLADIGHYYRDYVDLLDHYDRVLPGRVHSISYEKLVEDPEAEVRRVLDYLDLPFESSCLRFHENQRPVRTPSSEQVRRPINRDAVDQWRTYEPWLGELKEALGPLAHT